MLTARAQASEHARGIAVGADVYLTKPFRIAELLEAVAALIQAKPRGDSRPA
jgi:DNA-binding response OmpR family regulator